MNYTIILKRKYQIRIDIDAAARILKTEGAVEHPALSGLFVFAGTQKNSEQALGKMLSDPDKPQWIIVVSLDDYQITIQRETTEEIMRIFIDILRKIVDYCSIDEIYDEEQNLICAGDIDKMLNKIMT